MILKSLNTLSLRAQKYVHERALYVITKTLCLCGLNKLHMKKRTFFEIMLIILLLFNLLFG